jgi:hypothetical protein
MFKKLFKWIKVSSSPNQNNIKKPPSTSKGKEFEGLIARRERYFKNKPPDEKIKNEGLSFEYDENSYILHRFVWYRLTKDRDIGKIYVGEQLSKKLYTKFFKIVKENGKEHTFKGKNYIQFERQWFGINKNGKISQRKIGEEFSKSLNSSYNRSKSKKEAKEEKYEKETEPIINPDPLPGEIRKIFIGIPQRIKDEVFWVGKDYRINPLSFEGHIFDIIIEYFNGDILGYDSIKYPHSYVLKTISNMKQGVNIEVLNEDEQLLYVKEKIKGIYSKNYEDSFTKENADFQLMWDYNSYDLPWEVLEKEYNRVNENAQL